ncbi:MAG: peptide deformylase [Bacteroidia bacterium]|nr:peptide deformylase [Bacteroidia bacterium]
MILPIVGYGHPALRKRAEPIGPEYPGLAELIQNMYDTMYNAQGVGLAAPQIGLAVRLFIVDGSPIEEKGAESLKDFKQVFLNPELLEETGDEWAYDEGCLSIPDLREKVIRRRVIRLRYQTEAFETREERFDGMRARIIQHEYDHLEGVLFTDRVSSLRKQLLKPVLKRISQGQVDCGYPMKFSRR